MTSLKSHDTPNQLDPPRAEAPPTAAFIEEAVPIRNRTAVLVDLSGAKEAATEWASHYLEGVEITSISKAALKRGSKRQALRQIRALAPDTLAIFTSHLDIQSARGALMIFGVLAGARHVVIGDSSGQSVERSVAGVALLEAPRFVLELLVGYGVIVPLSWVLVWVLGLAVRVREIARAQRQIRRPGADDGRSQTALHIRATLSGLDAGGMFTHVAGFRSGAIALGHRLKLVESGLPDASMPETPRGVFSDAGRALIRPSVLAGATKALFELWNNLVFTTRALRLMRDTGGIDFIYQRYSRFNLTGVALSLSTGLPLALEFNGSEVWVSRHWDPIGQLRLLRRFERLSLRAADLIFVVSEVNRRGLIQSEGMDPGKVLVNPNGVDTNTFRPNRGGLEIRRALGIEHKVVVGFVGTFGPWHGAPLLARAATLVNENTDCHLLFVGDGDERTAAEGILQAAPHSVTATFTGRVAHNKVPAYLDACDILVSPHIAPTDGSEFFGSPTKLFEYMAMARPVVASRLGQIAEVIRDGENGVLVEPGDPLALARAIEMLAADRARCARLGTAARETVIDRYTWRHNAARVFGALAGLALKARRHSAEID